MPLASIQQYVQGILDDMPVPGIPQTMSAQVTPPLMQSMTRPIAFVWGGTVIGTRQSGPRGIPPAAGFRHLAWDITTTLVLTMNPGMSGAPDVFPALVDAAVLRMWTTPMPVFIDPQGVPCVQGTDGATQILSVGEDYRMEYAPVHTLADQRTLYYSARASWQIYEAVQG